MEDKLTEKQLYALKNDLAHAKSQLNFWKNEIKKINKKIKTFNPNFEQLEMDLTNEY